LVHLDVHDLVPWEITQDRLPCNPGNSHEVIRSRDEQFDTIALDLAEFGPEILHDINSLLHNRNSRVR
jgi:hypothetical protein